MLKIEWIGWSGQDDHSDLITDIAQTGASFSSSPAQIMTRPWAKDPNFVEVGIFTEDMPLAKFLARTYHGKVWIQSPKGA